MLIAVVPDGGDIEAAIIAEAKNAGLEIGRGELSIETGLILTDEPAENDDIRYAGFDLGVLTDENGTNFEYAVKPKPSVETEFLEAEQNWQEESTTYWFELSGRDYGTEYEFNSDVYGVIESGSDDAVIVNADNCPLTEGDAETVAVRNSVAVTDNIRGL